MTADDHPVRVERGARRIRAYLRGHLVLDTIEPRLVWETPMFPVYYVPRQDVVAELVDTGHVRESRRRGTGRLWTVQVGDAKAGQAATTYDDSLVDDLHGLVRVDWNAMDAWFEEDEQVFVHARDPYTRVDILPTSRHVRVERAGVVLAETVRAMALFETGLPTRFYLPKTDVRMDLLEHSSTLSYCPYKGEAEYWHLRSGRHEVVDIAWSYRHPLDESVRIGAMMSFDPAKADVIVDGIAQR
jgi:uncharacterized protein (DUF427 family)